jgi:hypothetical protein
MRLFGKWLFVKIYAVFDFVEELFLGKPSVSIWRKWEWDEGMGNACVS